MTMLLDVVAHIIRGMYDLTTVSYITLVNTVVVMVGLQPDKAPTRTTRLMPDGEHTITMKDLRTITPEISGLNRILHKLSTLLFFYIAFGLKPSNRSSKHKELLYKYPKLRHKESLFLVKDWKKFKRQNYLAMQQGYDRDFTYLFYLANGGKKGINVRKNILLLNYKPFKLRSITTFNKFAYAVRRHYENGGCIIINGEVVTHLDQLFLLRKDIFVRSHWEAVGIEGLKSITFGQYTPFNKNALSWIETLNPDVEYYRLMPSGPVPIDYEDISRYTPHETFQAEDPDTYGMSEEEYAAYMDAKEQLEIRILTGQDKDLIAQCEARNAQLNIPMYYIDYDAQKVKLSLVTFLSAHPEAYDHGKLDEEDILAIAAAIGVEVEDDRGHN